MEAHKGCRGVFNLVLAHRIKIAQMRVHALDNVLHVIHVRHPECTKAHEIISANLPCIPARSQISQIDNILRRQGIFIINYHGPEVPEAQGAEAQGAEAQVLVHPHPISHPPSLAFARSNAQTQGGQQVEQANLSRAELVRRKEDLRRRTIAAHNTHLDAHGLAVFAKALLLLLKASR
jgi:hypothetical protein